jgi:glycine cleavage system H lipoate-binding protein
MKSLDDRFWMQVLEGSKEGKLRVRLGLHKALADKIGPTVFVAEQVKLNDRLHPGALLFVVESTKAAMDIEAPLELEISGINSTLKLFPQLVFEDPQGNGWLVEGWIKEKI